MSLVGSRDAGGRPKLGLALGAGAMRGLAHIGVLQVLLREGVPIDVIAGTSIGAVVAGAYAAGRTADMLEHIACELQELAYFDLTLPKMGVLAGRRVQKLCGQITMNKTFEETHIPCGMVTCALDTGEEIVLTEGPLDVAIRASISIPGVFVPSEIAGRLCVDGGLCNRVPVSVARALGAERVIGVDVGYRGEPMRPKGMIGILLQSYDIMEWQVARQRSSDADLMISPDVRGMNPAHMAHVSESIAKGREAAEAVLDSIWKLLEGAS
jgi:NTE family protein